MFKKALYTNVAYDIMREKQEELHSEYVMSSTFEEYINQDIHKTFKTDFIIQTIEEKHYYSRVLFLTTFNSKKIPFTNNDAFSTRAKEQDIFHIPLIFCPADHNLFAKNIITLEKKGALSNELLDIITFSIIPSFYLMFLENSTFNMFYSLINALKDQKYLKLSYQLSRSLFVSPMFLRFLRKIMHSLLQPVYLSDPRSISITKLKELIKQSFIQNANFIPSYMKTFFNKVKDTFNFLKESLFTPILENPDIFLLVDFYQKDDHRMANFKVILKKIFDDEFIQEISKIIDETHNTEKSIFITENSEVQQAQAEINDRIIDTIDKQALLFMNKVLKGQNVDNSSIFDSLIKVKYQLFRSIFSEEENGYSNEESFSDINHKFIQNTIIIEMQDKWMFLRKLLKNAQPLPIIKIDEPVPVNSDSFRKLIEEKVLCNVDPFNIIDAEISLELFNTEDDSIRFVEPFKRKMNDLIIRHDEQTIVMQVISKFNKELTILKNKRKDVIDLMTKRFSVHLLDLYEFDKNYQHMIPVKINDIKNPIYCIKKLQGYIEKQASRAKELFNDEFSKILCGRFYRNFDFNTFLSLRPELKKFDDIICDLLHKNISECFKDDNAFKKIIEKVSDTSVFNNSFSEINKALEMNCGPIEKYNAIYNSFNQIILDLFKYSGEFGEDEKTAFFVYALHFISPPYLISNIIFLLDYLDINSPMLTNEDCFDQLNGIINVVDKYSTIFKKYTFERLAQNLNKRCELFISGNDPVVITKSLKKIIFAIKEKDKMTDQIFNSIIEKLENNKGKVFQCHKPTAKLANKGLSMFIHFDMRIGVDIPLDQVGGKDYLKRIAFYFFSSRKSSFGSKDLKNFINNKKIDNHDKIIIRIDQDKKLPSHDNIATLDLNDFNNKVANILYNFFYK